MNKIIQGDCLEEMKKLEENSVEAIITDPPYGLQFMGKEWDTFNEYSQEKQTKPDEYKSVGRVRYYRKDGKPVYWNKPTYVPKEFKFIGKNQDKKNKLMENFFFYWAIECLRVLKPGGFLLSFGGTRTYHRLVCGIEDAGFEIRDTIMWLYGSGFPKSLNIGKQIDKLQGNEREIIEIKEHTWNQENNSIVSSKNECGGTRRGLLKDEKFNVTRGSSEWEGWGTALKPACEPIVVARKPLSEKNVALNVLKWGTGGINIDVCRVGISKEDFEMNMNKASKNPTDNYAQSDTRKYGKYKEDRASEPNSQGRFPANIILDEEAGKMFPDDIEEYDNSKQQTLLGETLELGSKSASRFFYCAKASKSERNFGMEVQKEENKRPIGEAFGEGNAITDQTKSKGNNHPTVKPIALMEYLIKLVSKEGAIVLDPFVGSGTTIIACLKLNRQSIGIEKEEEYIKIAKARIKPFLEQTKLSA